MRKLVVFASALAFAAPAMAQDEQQRLPAEQEIVRDLPRPGEIEELGDALGRVADAVMDVKVGPVVEAIDPGRRLSRRERERTLGDVATRDDPHARERMRDSIDTVTYGLGGMVERLAILTPVLRRTLEDTAHRVDEAIREGRHRRERSHVDTDPDRDRDD